MNQRMRLSPKYLLAGSLGLALGSAVQACGPDFPVTLLDRREAVMGLLPEGGFHFEAARLVARPVPALTPVEWNDWDDHAEKLRAVEVEGLTAAGADAITAMRAAPDAATALALAGELPREVALYTAGAVAWHARDYDTALMQFRAVLALPAVQQTRRGIWASYMEGETLAMLGQDDAAYVAWRGTREMVGAGAPDPLGLALASLGEEARLRRMHGELAAAVRLYAEQAAHGSTSGNNSLLFVARAALADPAEVDALLADAVGTRLLLAYLYARSNELTGPVPEGEYAELDAPADGPRLLAVLDRIAKLPTPPDSDRLGAIAYRAGRFDVAGQLAKGPTPLAAWVRAKLALRTGRLDDAAREYAQAAEGFPASEHWGTVRVEGADWGNTELKPRCRVQGEAGTLALSRGDYVQALELLFAGATQYWSDAAYVAERVLTLDELLAFVQRVAPQAIHGEGRDANLADPAEGTWHPMPPGMQLRALLARRLLRERPDAQALQWIDDPALREQALLYLGALTDAQESWTRVGRARAWFRAAGIARWRGMELLGYEGDPDYFIWGGSYDLNSPVTWDEDYNPVFHARSDLRIEGPWTSDGERARVAASRAQPLERFHYRLTAAAHAAKAADALPPRSQAFAAVLCEATRWLIDRYPDPAQGLYRRYLREGAFVPWGTDFGRQCPAPDFDKVEHEIRAAWIRDIGRWGLWLGVLPLLVLLGHGARLFLRSRSQRSGA